MSFLPYDLISCSSKDSKLIEEHSKSAECAVDGNEVCWFTKSDHSFPQSLVVKLEETTRIGRIDIVAHPQYLPSSMTIAFGLEDSRIRNPTGRSYEASYSIRSQLSFDDDGGGTKTVYLSDDALFIRFTVHGFLHTEENAGRQIGILSIVIRGLGGSGYSRNTTARETSLHDMLGLSSLSLGSSSYQRVVSPQPPRPSVAMVHLDSDSDDEEVLFTRDMVRRLEHKTKQLQATRPDSSLSDSGMSSASSKEEDRKSAPKQTKPDNRKISMDSSATETNEKVPEASGKNVDDATVISPRTRDRVLKEIAEFGEEFGLSPGVKGGTKNQPKKYYFGKRMAELNNTIRILEAKREEAIWKENYLFAHEIDTSLSTLRSREAPMKELLTERMDALEKNDLLTAHRLKSRFEVNMEEALKLPGLEKFLSPKEMERIRYEAANAQSKKTQKK